MTLVRSSGAHQPHDHSYCTPKVTAHHCVGHDEYHFLSEIVKQSFAPECFQDVLLNGGPPPWVAELISDSRGRDLIFQLAAAHTTPNPFLGWAIKHIIDAGHEPPVPPDRRALAPAAAHKCALSLCSLYPPGNCSAIIK